MRGRSNLGSQLARKRLLGSDTGRGLPVGEPTEPIDRVWTSFAKGLRLDVEDENVPEDATADAIDIELTRRGALRRVAGVSLVATLTNTPQDVAVHSNYISTSDIVLVSPPNFGYWKGNAQVWANVALAAVAHRFANFGGTLLITDGARLLEREVRSLPSVVAGAPGGKVIVAFGDRVYIFNTTIGDSHEPQGVRWCAPADYTIWDAVVDGLDTGAGFEILLTGELGTTDEVVGVAPHNLDWLAIFCRHSIWIGIPSTDPTRPLDFRRRMEEVGCLADKTIQPTPLGTLFLDEEGVRLFDGNAAPVVSDAINDLLLPIDESATEGYTSSYNKARGLYILHTPTHTFTYEVSTQRWLRRSLLASASLRYPVQPPDLGTWETAVGTWAEQTSTWLGAGEGALSVYFIQGNKLGVESEAVETFFGVAASPYWTFPERIGSDPLVLVAYESIGFRTRGTGTLRFELPNVDGVMVAQPDIVLTALRERRIEPSVTGLGSKLRVRIVSGYPEITRMRLLGTLAGDR